MRVWEFVPLFTLHSSSSSMGFRDFKLCVCVRACIWTTSSSDLKWNAPIYPRTRTFQPATIPALIVWRFVYTNTIHVACVHKRVSIQLKTQYILYNKMYCTVHQPRTRVSARNIFFSFCFFGCCYVFSP